MPTTIVASSADQAVVIASYLAAFDGAAVDAAVPLPKEPPRVIARAQADGVKVYIAIFALYVLLMAFSPLVGVSFSIVLSYVPVWWAIRRCNTGPRWFAFAVALFAIAWVLPPANTLLVSIEHIPRYIGNAAALLMLMFCRTSTYRPVRRRLRSAWRRRAFFSRRPAFSSGHRAAFVLTVRAPAAYPPRP
jgi:hypothetical protein